MPYLGVAVCVSAATSIAGHYLKPPRPWLVYIFKPLTTALILVIALLPGTFLTHPYARLVALGLLFSLFGDIWLVLPGDRFLQGLASFLVGLVFYIFAFWSGARGPGFPAALIVLGTVGAAMLGYLWTALHGALKPAVEAYIAVMVWMAALAVGRATGEPTPATASAATGAVLFLISDSMLAIDRFRRPFRFRDAAVLSTYFAGQLLIALSV